MKTLEFHEILNSKEFKGFYKAALEYCEFLRLDLTSSTSEFLVDTREKLLNLYNRGLHLQWVNLRSSIDFQHKLDNFEFESLLSSLAERLNGKRYYWHVFDPSNQEDISPVCGDLVDDLGDIYKDLSWSIITFNLEEPDCQENAIWEFKFFFEKHWGDHCMNALWAIHFILQQDS